LPLIESLEKQDWGFTYLSLPSISF
jgi:hypothetical protein